MYHPDVIAARERQILAIPGMAAIYPDGVPAYGVEESLSLTAHLTALRDPKTGALSRSLTEDEETFIAATQLRCLFDFPYFGERFVWIDESGHGLRPLYPLWESQRLVLAQLGRLEKQRLIDQHPDGLLVNVLKARQLGVSTLSEALVAHRVVTRPHVRALAGADVEDQAGYLFRMVGRIYDQLPWFLRPDRLTYVKNREMTFANSSFLKTAWGKSTRGALSEVGGQGSKGAIGRGQTFSVVHISELATWDNPEQLDAALFPAIPMHRDTLVILESTAEHAQDWWHQQWLATAEGHGRFANLFIPWYAEPGKYSLPAPEGWSPAASTVAHAEKCERDAARWLGETRSLTPDQQYWYETTRAFFARKGELHKFLKEYPADDLECFQYAGRAIFTFEQLERIDQVGSRRGIQDVWRVEPAWEIASLRREESLSAPQPPAPDRRPLPPLAPKQPGAYGIAAATEYPVPPGYGFQRLSAQELADLPNLRQGVLVIWEYPRARGPRRYVMSVDVGDGIGGDYTVIDIIRLPTIEEPAEQVAQWVSNRHDTKAAAFVADAIGRLYSDAEGIEALAAVECNNHGLAVQDTLQLHLGYAHFYIWEYADSADPSKRFSTKIGWQTTPRTRPLLLNSFHAAITTVDPVTETPDLILNSPITRGELRHFVTESTIGEAEAARGQHDDCVLSAAIGYYVAWRQAGGEHEPIAERRRRRAALRAQQQTEASRRLQPRGWRNAAITADEARGRTAGGDDGGDDADDESSEAGGGGLSYFTGGGRDHA